MKVTKRTFYSIIFVSSLLILGACGDKDNVDLSEASSVDEDNVTSKYYDEMNEMINAFPIYFEKMLTEGVQTSTIEHESRQYLLLINSLDLIPISKVDKEFDTYVYEFKIKSELAAEYMLDYASSGKIRDKNNAEEYMREVVEAFEMIKEITYKYAE